MVSAMEVFQEILELLFHFRFLEELVLIFVDFNVIVDTEGW